MKTKLLITIAALVLSACGQSKEGTTNHGVTVTASQIKGVENSSISIDLSTCTMPAGQPFLNYACTSSLCTQGCGDDGITCKGDTYTLTCNVGGVSCFVNGGNGQWYSVDSWASVYGKPGCLNL
jgi:hypothetical protein